MKELNNYDLLKNFIYRRAMVVTTMALHKILTDDKLFNQCEKKHLNEIGITSTMYWTKIIKDALDFVGWENCIYKEQGDYVLRFAVVTIASIFRSKFDILKRNRKKYDDPEELMEEVSMDVLESIYIFDELYKRDFGEIKEDVPD